MVEFSILRLVCFLIPLCFLAFPGAINFCISGFFLKKSIIIYIYFIKIPGNYKLKTCSELFLEPVPQYTLINHPYSKNL
jgi:hypothetical protein